MNPFDREPPDWLLFYAFLLMWVLIFISAFVLGMFASYVVVHILN